MVSQERFRPELQNEWESFKKDLSPISTEKQFIINKAYHYSRNAHQGTKRESGEPYHTHVEAVARTLLDCNITDPNIIAAALLHDVVEDTPAASDTKDLDNTTSRRMSQESLAKEFNPTVAEWVLGSSKPKIEGIEIKNKYERDKVMKEEILEQSGAEVALIKMADRLHNAQTLEPIEKKRRDATIFETVTFYLPFFERKVKPVYPDAYDYMVGKLEKALAPFIQGSPELY